MYETRLAALRQITNEAGLDAVALIPGSNLMYLTGEYFPLMERPTICLYPRQGDPVFILPTLEVEKVSTPPYPLRVYAYTDTEGYAGAFSEALAALSLDGRRLGVEGGHMRFFEAQALVKGAPRMQLIDAGEALATLRIRKDAAEVAALRRAVAVAQDGLLDLLPGIRVGMTERQIAGELMIAMLKRGSSEMPFSAAVLSGPNSALPHGVPGDRALQEGDLLLFDYGAQIDGYASDITRTFAIGELRDQRLLDAYAAVQAANEAGRRAAGPGVPCQEVDRAARAAIEKAGFGQYFTHRTGHGLGMEVHEGPYIRAGNTELLQPGNVHTVEPGVYLPGVGGVRIEDDVLITADGAESLTSLPRDLQIIGG